MDDDLPFDQGRWVMISVLTDGQWEGLQRALGFPDWAADPVLATVAGRRAAHDSIDAELAAWCARQAADEAVAALLAEGVPAAKIMLGHEQPELVPLVERQYFTTVEHPVTGKARHGGFPARFGLGPEPRHLHRAASPRLGEHNRAVLGGLLGIDDAELDALEAAGVIGQQPAGTGTAW